MGQINTFFTDRTGTVTTLPIYPQRSGDESGIFQIDWDESGTFTINLEGRASSEADWYVIEQFTETSIDDHNNLALSGDTTIASVVVIFPEMRCVIKAISSATLGAWLVE